MDVKGYVPHDQLTPGYWYLRTQYEPFYTVVKIMTLIYGDCEGKLSVWLIADDECTMLESFDADQFIGPVPAPEKV